jgi:ABC-type multidrug transport system ATPase subunit
LSTCSCVFLLLYFLPSLIPISSPSYPCLPPTHRLTHPTQATSALDSITENSIQEALLALGQNRTLLVIAHRLSTIRHADQIVVLDKGRVKEVGSHEQLMGREGVYAQMWNMQLGQGHGPSPVAGDSDGDRGSSTNLAKEETESASV